MKTWQTASLVQEGNPYHEPSGSPSGGQFANASNSAVVHAKGVIAAKQLGGQVPQKHVNAAERTLRKEGLLPSERKAPKKIQDIGDFYEKNRPVKGDTWTFAGGKIEVGRLLPRRVNVAGAWKKKSGTEIEYTSITPKGGRTSMIYINKTWPSKE